MAKVYLYNKPAHVILNLKVLKKEKEIEKENIYIINDDNSAAADKHDTY